MELYNTESKQKEVVSCQDNEYIYMYTCGPTVYNYAHIGNFRTYVFEDILRRTIQFFNMRVVQVMNITDVDDKTIKGALEKKISLQEYTKPYIDAFFEDIRTLNIEPAEYYPRATEYIKDIIEMISVLLDKGYAYVGKDGSVYYSIKKFSTYGRLSHLKLNELQTGASQRVSGDEYEKDSAADFVLWKIYDPKRDGKVFWESPFGKGRPGWHIECSCMALKLLKSPIDIHCGGVDNIFPHHENEIAQSEAYSSKRFVKVWAHSEYLVVDNKKMSKSLNNFYTLRDLLEKGYTKREIRYMLMHVHYRTKLNFTLDGMKAAKESLRRIDDFIERLSFVKTESNESLEKQIEEKAINGFQKALADDLNISLALASIFDFIHEINVLIDQNKISKDEAKRAISFMQKIDKVLGLNLGKKELSISDDIKKALEKREKARKEKDFKLADEMRDYIISHGYIIEDTPQGARIKKK